MRANQCANQNCANQSCANQNSANQNWESVVICRPPKRAGSQVEEICLLVVDAK